MVLWVRSRFHLKGFKFKIRNIYVIEFKSLSLFCDLKS